MWRHQGEEKSEMQGAEEVSLVGNSQILEDKEAELNLPSQSS